MALALTILMKIILHAATEIHIFCVQAQLEAQKAAVKYQDAFSTYTQAKDAVHEAELQLALEGQATTPLVDSTCQEIINKATIAVSEAYPEPHTIVQLQ